MTRTSITTAVLAAAAAFLAGYAGRLGVAWVVGRGDAVVETPIVSDISSGESESPHPAPVAKPDLTRDPHAQPDGADDADDPAAAIARHGTKQKAASRASATDDAVGAKSTDAAEATASAPEPLQPPELRFVAEIPLGQTARTFTEAPLLEPCASAMGRMSTRNAAHPSALQSTSFRFVAVRSGDRFEITVGEGAPHYRASPRTWAMMLAAESGMNVPPEKPKPQASSPPNALSAGQYADLLRAIDDRERGIESLRRDVWTLLRDDAGRAKPPALDPRDVAAVFAGAHGVAVIPAGADPELDRLLDELEGLESTARSDVEYLLR